MRVNKSYHILITPMVKIQKVLFILMTGFACFFYGVQLIQSDVSTETANSLQNSLMSPATTGQSVLAESTSSRMLFDEALYNFGRIKQGEKVSKYFSFKNDGNGDLLIRDLKSSCGCTAAVASSGPYRPGESGKVEVNYDSRGKFGHVVKEVKVVSNASNSPQTIAVEGMVFADMHPSKTGTEALFSGSCAECHAVPAKGKKGAELYDAVCYMCHDFPQDHGKKWVAPDRVSLSRLSKSQLKRLIAKGIPQTSMPGFSDHSGGPLSKEQIESLVEYLHSIQKE